jgi:hypothetical protein
MFKTSIVAVAAIVLLGGCAVEGLHWAAPTTNISVSKDIFGARANIKNTKDTTVLMESFELDPQTGVAKITGLSITDNASDVRKANAEQMNAVALQTEIIADVTKTLGNSLVGLVHAFALREQAIDTEPVVDP